MLQIMYEFKSITKPVSLESIEVSDLPKGFQRPRVGAKSLSEWHLENKNERIL